MKGPIPGYPSSKQITMARLAATMPQADIERLDRWAISAGMRNRTAAIRYVVQLGLDHAEKSAKPSAS